MPDSGKPELGGRGRIALAIRVRGYALSIDRNPSPQPSPTRGEGAHLFCCWLHRLGPHTIAMCCCDRDSPAARARKQQPNHSHLVRARHRRQTDPNKTLSDGGTPVCIQSPVVRPWLTCCVAVLRGRPTNSPSCAAKPVGPMRNSTASVS